MPIGNAAARAVPPAFRLAAYPPRMPKLTVVYDVPDNAPEWLFRCAEDGDWNGMLEYAMNAKVESVRLT